MTAAPRPGFELALSPEQVKLVSLAAAYHLGRPGAEIDRTTMQPSAHGLAPVALELEAHQAAGTRLVLDEHQLRRLMEAMLQTINELKVLSMNEAPWSPGAGGGHSVNLRFEEAAARFYPLLRDAPGEAREVAGAMMGLHRRLANALREEPAHQAPPSGGRSTPGRRPPWWRRRPRS